MPTVEPAREVGTGVWGATCQDCRFMRRALVHHQPHSIEKKILRSLSSFAASKIFFPLSLGPLEALWLRFYFVARAMVLKR